MQGQSSNSNIRCFKCGEPGHRAIDCRKPASKTGKNLLIEDETVEEINIGDLIFYDSNEEEILYGDGHVSKVIIDSGSCENVVSEDAVKKLLLKTDRHLKPYKLSWLKKGSEVTVDKRCLVSFSIGKKYFDNA